MTFAAGAATATATAKPETPTMGWSSWNTYHVDISDKLIMHQADLIIELGLDKAGYEYVNIDDGWFGGRAEDGTLKAHPTRFPEGLKVVCDYIHSLGLKAGIYSDGGENTCGSRSDNDPWGIGVGFWNHDDQDARYLFGQHDFDFIKIDFCGGEPAGNHLKIRMNERERYTAIRRAVDKVRLGVRINVCRWDYPGTWVREVGSSWRMSRDIRPKWEIVRDIIRQNLYLGAYAAPGAYNDMDMLEVGRGMTEIEDYTHFAVWCFMSSPLLIGCDLEKVKAKPALRKLLTDKTLIALNKDVAEVQGRVVKRDGECYALVRDIEEPFGLTRAVLIVNLEDVPKRMRLELEEIDLACDTPETACGGVAAQKTPDSAIEAEIPAHGTAVFIRKGTKRLERTIYEAESGFMPTYQELVAPEKAGTAYYKEEVAASGGMVASGLGARAGNDLVFERVWSEKGGEYSLSVDYIGPGARALLAVNGVAADPSRFELKPGLNEVRLYNNDEAIADIDRISIHRAK